MAEALAGGAPVFAVAARRLHGDDRVFIEVAPLPSSITPGFGPRALVIVHGPRVDQARMAAAGSLYGLSASEASIAAQLAVGHSPAAVAHERGCRWGR